MSGSGSIYLFGDQTHDFVPGLRQLLRTNDSPLLSAFFDKTHLALRQEIAQQSRQTQELLPRFSNIKDLFAAYKPGHEAAPILASTLTTIYQLGSFIRYVVIRDILIDSKHPWILMPLSHYGDGRRQYPCGPNQVALGMCTGQLAASAVASASSAGELAYLAVRAVVIAFRTGIYVTSARNLLDNNGDRSQNWSYIVPKLSVETAASRIEQFSDLAVSLLLLHGSTNQMASRTSANSHRT